MSEVTPEAVPTPSPSDNVESFRASGGLRKSVSTAVPQVPTQPTPEVPVDVGTEVAADQSAVPSLPRDDQGRFVSPAAKQMEAVKQALAGQGEPSTEADLESPEVLAEEPGDGTPDVEVEAATEAPETVTIELPENHPLRDRGIESIPNVPPELENEFRNIVNNPIRRAEVDEAWKFAESAQSQLLSVQAEAEKWQKATEFGYATMQRLLLDDSFIEQLRAYRDIHGDAGAQRFLQVTISGDQDQIIQMGREVDEKYQSIQRQKNAHVETRRVLATMKEDFPLFSKNDREVIVSNWMRQVQAGARQFSMADLADYATPMYQRLPQVVQNETARQQREAEAKANAERRTAETQLKKEANPIGRMPTVGAATPPSTQVDPSQINVRDYRKQIRRSRSFAS